MLPDDGPRVLMPFQRAEAITINEAAQMAGRSTRCVREWCLRHDIGRRVGGRWAVRRIALAALLDGDRQTLTRYLAGDRTSTGIVDLFRRCDVPLPRCSGPFREAQLSEPTKAMRP